MRSVRPLAAGALAAGALLTASPAGAANCVGEASTFVVCVVPPTPVVGERILCVFAGGEECTEVPVPTVGLSGDADVNCGGPKLQATCYVVNNLL